MTPTTSLTINPSLWILWNGMGDEEAAGVVAGATELQERQEKRWVRGPTYHKVSNNFEVIGRRNPLRAAKFEGGVSDPEDAGGTPRKRHDDGAPRKKARGGEDPFLFLVDRKRARTTEHAKANPLGIVAQRDGLGNAGAPKATYGIEAETIDEFTSDDEAASVNARAWAARLASAAPEAASADAGGSEPHRASAASAGGSREAGSRGAPTAEQAKALKATYGLGTANKFNSAIDEATKVDPRSLAARQASAAPGIANINAGSLATHRTGAALAARGRDTSTGHTSKAPAKGGNDFEVKTVEGGDSSDKTTPPGSQARRPGPSETA